MNQYMISVWHVAGEEAPSPETMRQIVQDVGAFNAKLATEGIEVFGAGLHPPETATDALEALGCSDEAAAAFDRAMTLTTNTAEIELLRTRRDEALPDPRLPCTSTSGEPGEATNADAHGTSRTVRRIVAQTASRPSSPPCPTSRSAALATKHTRPRPR